MKKFLSFFCVAVMLTVSLCVPAFACTNSEHDIDESGWCSDCLEYCSHEDTVDGYCAYCGLLVCSHEWECSPDYHFCLNCGIEDFHAFDDSYCAVCGYYSSSDGDPLPDNSAPDDSTPDDSASILPDVTSGVTSVASWVSTFANTIVSTPILLVSAILALFGFGVGLFKRLRT